MTKKELTALSQSLKVAKEKKQTEVVKFLENLFEYEDDKCSGFKNDAVNYYNWLAIEPVFEKSE